MTEILAIILGLIGKYKPVIEGLVATFGAIQNILGDDTLEEDEKLARIKEIAAEHDDDFDRRLAEARARLDTQPD